MVKKFTPKVVLDPSKVLGRFRPNSQLGRMVILLADGRARTPKEIQRVVHANSVQNIALGKLAAIRRWLKASKQGEMRHRDGKIQLVLNAKAKTTLHPRATQSDRDAA